MYFKDKVSFTDLESLLNNITENPHIISSLPKNLTEYDSYESIIDDLESSERKSRIRKIYNEFPSEQKSYIDLDKDGELLFLLSNRSDKNNFIKKISSFHNRSDLQKRLKSFLESESDKEFDDIIKKLKDNNSIIYYSSKEDNLIISRILTYEECKKLGSDTSWCIAGSKYTFLSYVPNELTHQFIIYLTDKDIIDLDRKIGVTFNIPKEIGDTGFKTAHNVRDNYISYEKLKSILIEYNYDIEKLKVGKNSIEDIDSTSVKVLLLLGFSQEEISEKKSRYTSDDLNHLSNETISKYDLLNKIEFNGRLVEDLSGQEMETKWHLIIPETLRIVNIMHIHPRYIKKNKDIILNKMNNDKRNARDISYHLSDKSIFKENFYINKSDIKSAYDYQVGSHYSNTYNLGLTLYKLRFFMVGPSDFSLEELAGAFDNIRISDFKIIHSYINMNGYDNSSDEELTNFYLKIAYTGSFDTKVPLYYKLIKELNIDCKEQFLQYIKSKNSTHYPKLWDKCDLDKIKSIFTKEELEDVMMYQNKAAFIKSLIQTAKMHSLSLSDRKKEFKVEDFYTNWNSYVQIYDIPKSLELWIGLIFIYAKLNKLDELSRVNFNWKSKEFVHNLCKAIVEKWKYNSSLHIGLTLTDMEKESIYKWMMSDYSMQLSEIIDYSNKDRATYYQLQVLFYLYDKEMFNEYLDECAIDNKLHIRIINLTALLNYLKSDNKFSEIRKLIEKISKWQYTITEKRLTHQWLVENLDGDSYYTDKINKYNTNYKEVVDKYFKV